VSLDQMQVESNEFDLVVIPGGAKGAETLSQDKQVQRIIQDQLRSGRIVGMICAGSLAALTSKIYESQKYSITSHPSVKDQLVDHFDYSDDPVVVSGNLVTR